jgi:alpha-ketoglutarate-dependent taurine dioxygenase
MKHQQLSEAQPIPYRIEPDDQGSSLISWIDQHRDSIEELLRYHGALLFHNFHIKALAEFRRAAMTLSTELIEQYEAPTPRTELNNRIYTSTDYPQEYSIPMHNEMSHTHKWPGKIWFYCHIPATNGGETPIADSRRVYALIDPDIRQQFLEKKLMYTRNYSETGDLLNWREVFHVSTRDEAEAYFREVGISFQWKPDGGLRTRQVREAIIHHPTTQEYVWFNQAHIFHISNLPSQERVLLERQFEGREEDLPYHTSYGDGTLIELDILDHIREAYQIAEITFPWQKGDALLLDNMLCAHGRKPFEGPRNIYVAMAEPHRSITEHDS